MFYIFYNSIFTCHHFALIKKNHTQQALHHCHPSTTQILREISDEQPSGPVEQHE